MYVGVVYRDGGVMCRWYGVFPVCWGGVLLLAGCGVWCAVMIWCDAVL